MNKFELDYRTLLKQVLMTGYEKESRTGVNTKCVFDANLRIDLSKGFPIITGKQIFFDKAYHEYIWFSEGMVTNKYLKQHGIHWWDVYATSEGYLGRTYGYQLRSFNENFDQLQYCISQIKMGTRRAHITLWNPEDMVALPLPVCYTGFTFVITGKKLNMSMQFRSSDLFLGLPYDICVGALLLTDVAEFCELEPCVLSVNLADAHIYKNHVTQVNKYLECIIYPLPKYNNEENKLINYKHGEFIKTPLNI